MPFSPPSVNSGIFADAPSSEHITPAEPRELQKGTAPPAVIPLTQGLFALVDEADFQRLSQWKWLAVKARKTFYAARQTGGKNGTLILMHREILGLAPGDKSLADHRDRNGLNNQRSNLRVATPVQSASNRLKAKSRGLIGVRKSGNKWKARIVVDGHFKHLGTFATVEKAIAARDKAALQLHGEFAVLNKPVILHRIPAFNHAPHDKSAARIRARQLLSPIAPPPNQINGGR